MTANGPPDRKRGNGKNAFFLWGPPVIMFLVILVLSLTPGSMYPEHPEIFNIIIHFLEFVFLAYFLTRALLPIRNGKVWESIILTVLVCALIGLMTELLQFTVPQRMFDVMDMLIDISGAFIGAFLYINVIKIHTTRQLDKEHIPGTDDVRD
jgi:VanZ family protein